MGQLTCRGKENRISVRYKNSERFDGNRYIHKYYLSPEDKAALFPIDIFALQAAASELQISWHEEIPNVLPEYTICYKDLGFEKKIECPLMQRAFLAIAEYWQDRNAELTPDEVEFALFFNQWLIEREKSLLEMQLSLEQDLNMRYCGRNNFFMDYLILLNIYFSLRDDDPYSSNDDALDDLTFNICKINYHYIHSPEHRPGTQGYRGLGDGHDYREPANKNDNPVTQERHCMLFHKLTEEAGVPYKHLARIGYIWTDFIVQCQDVSIVVHDKKLSTIRWEKS
jgi:hypothetical protein